MGFWANVGEGAKNVVKGTGKGAWGGVKGTVKGGFWGSVGGTFAAVAVTVGIVALTALWMAPVVAAVGAIAGLLGIGSALGAVTGLGYLAAAVATIGSIATGAAASIYGVAPGMIAGGVKGSVSGFLKPFKESHAKKMDALSQQVASNTQEIQNSQNRQQQLSARMAAAQGFDNPLAGTGFTERAAASMQPGLKRSV